MSLLTARKEFMDKKTATNPYKETVRGTQDAFEISRVSPDGTFQVGKSGDNRYSRSYMIEDTSYKIKEYKEQLIFLEQWCKTLNAFESDIKISIINNRRDIEYLKTNIMYAKKGDSLDKSREAYNDIIWNKAVVEKNGIEQVKILTVSTVRNSYKEAAASLDSLEANLIKDFGYLQSGLIPMNGNERLKIIYDSLQPERVGKYDLDLIQCIAKGRDWRNEIAMKNCDFSHNDYMKINNLYYKAMYLSPQDYPSTLSDEFFAELSTLTACSIFTIDYIPIKKNIVKETIEQKLMGIQADIDKQLRKRRNQRDYSAEPSYKLQRESQEVREMLDDINDNDQKMFWCGITVIITGESREELRMNESTVTSITEKYSCKLQIYKIRQREALNTALPIGVRQVDSFRAMFTQSACILLPFTVTEIQNTKSKYAPMYYGVNKISKNAILENRKNLLNGNGFVFGIPGGGKSFTGAKLEMGSVYLNTKDNIIIVDPTLEYFDVSDAFGGEKLKISLDTKMYFNPMETDFLELEQNTETIISEKSQLVQGICEQCMGKGKFEAGHATLADRAVRNLYRSLLKIPEEKRKMPVMGDLYNELKNQREEDANALLLALELFIDGSYNIFNHETNIDIENRMIVYGMKDLTGNERLSGVSMLIMLENIKKAINENAKINRATWLYIDEIHILLNSPYSRQYLVTLFKLVRKLGGICTGITQNVCDLLKDDDTSTLISNSEYTLFLKQAAPDASLLLKTFTGMNKEHISHVTNAVPGTGLIRFGNTIIPMDNRIEKGNPIYDIFNTNLHEKAAMEKAARARQGQ